MILKTKDEDFNQPSTVDLIIGAGHYEEPLIGDKRIKEPQKPITYRLSCFGWLVIGRESQLEKKSTQLQSFFICSEPDNLQRFWEIEEIPTITQWTSEQQKCENHFKSTTRRNSEGRFVVKLPFKDSKPLGDSYHQAKRRLRSLIFRLEKQPDVYNRYSQFIQEFIELGHMEEVPRNKIHMPATNCFYLPHHCVIKDASSTTKLRVVFDASAKSTSGVSLNDRLLVGPQFQKDLFGILIRFRFHQVALPSDIAKMYRQLQLDDEDKDFHRVLWKNPNDTEVKTYRMTRVTYGITSSSYHSIRPLKALADSCTHSNLRPAINNDMYVDDLLTGASDVEHTTQLQDEIIATLKTACFDIRKWTSSVSSLVERLPTSLRETPDEMIINSNDYGVKTLGIKWSPVPDHFTFTVCLDKDFPTTKRKILSEVTKLFDPLGWLSPTTIQLKFFLQILWMDKLTWDETLSLNILKQYGRFRLQVKELEKIKLERRVFAAPFSSSLELHVFCDASTTAYAAVVYVREHMDDRVHTQMLTAKTRVAPIKTLCPTFRTLCSTSWSTIVSSSEKKPSMTADFPTPKSLPGPIHK